MPSRAVHKKLTWTLLVISSPAITCVWPLGALFEAGIAVTLLPIFTPDLDINSRKFGWLSDFVGFKAYAELVPHRFGLARGHWRRLKPWQVMLLSHIPLAGTLARTILLFIPIIFLLLLFSAITSDLAWAFVLVWLGMSISDLVHVTADIMTSDFKEWKQEFWFRRRKYARKKRNPSYF